MKVLIYLVLLILGTCYGQEYLEFLSKETLKWSDGYIAVEWSPERGYHNVA